MMRWCLPMKIKFTPDTILRSMGRLAYAASNMELEKILGNEGCNCSKLVFDNSFWQPQVTAGVLREKSLVILKEYFEKHEKG